MSLFVIFLIFYIVRTFRNILHQIFLWQLKEYRLDRIVAHLRTPQGKKLFLGPFSVLKRGLFFLYIILAGYALIIGHDLITGFGFILIFIFFALPIIMYVTEGIRNISELIKRGWRVPKWTLKSISIFVIAFALLLYIFSLSEFWKGLDYPNLILVCLIVDNLLALTIFFAVLILNIPTYIYKVILIFIARQKMLSMKNLLVIGITGSYGKTSTKEFLATILSAKFKVTKTPEFTNTDIGIAQYILRKLKPEHEIFVVEMGAYKKGEIKAICDMVKPKIGIITGINEQHLELFGSIENTKKAKFELIESLPKDGVAIFNGNNNQCLEMAEWAKERELKVSTYNTASDVKDIKIFTDHIEFNFMDKNKSYQFRVNLLGIQSIKNLLAAIYAARCLRMNLAEIQKSSSKIVSPSKTMQLVGSKKDVTLVDDTFNANPDGVIAAVDYMKIFRGKKILVLTPLIELDQESEKIHKFLGERIARICDLILLTNPNYHKSFIEGAKKAGGEDKVRIVNVLVGLQLIGEYISNDGVVVFEGKEAGRILNQLTKIACLRRQAINK